MTDRKIEIDTSAKVPKPKKRRGYIFWLAAFAILCYLASIFALFPAFVRKKLNPGVQQSDRAAMLQVPTDEAPADESKLQWISPTAGPPITLEYVPLGTQVILHLRPAELITHGEGEKIVAALGPWGEGKIVEIESEVGTDLAEIESLLIAIHRDADHLDYAIRATRSEPWSDEDVQELRNAMGAIDRTAFLPKSGQGRVLVTCSGSAAAEIESRGSEPPLLARDLERLLPLTDQLRTATLLMPTKFLNTEGRELVTDGGERLIAAFNALLPDNASAVMLSCDWRENFFCEVAATIVQNAPAHRFNAEFALHLDEAEELMAEGLASDPPHAYGKAVEERFPDMLRTMSDFTRISQNGGIAIARCYLPVQAGHNLLLASRLRLSGGFPAIESAQPVLPLSDRLQQVTTLSFPRETLENALEILAADAKLPIQIAGRDLQLEGITKNQTFTLDLRNRPVEEVLVEVLRKANPDREATDASDTRQKLVYVIRDDKIIVTTRAAAAQRDEELPEVFRVKQP